MKDHNRPNIDEGTSGRPASRRDVAKLAGMLTVTLAGGPIACGNQQGATPTPVDQVAAAAAQEIAREDEVPAAGGLVVAHANLVLTRDAEGEIRAFSALCTHKGCTVSGVSDGHITCPCHGSRFDAATGRPVAGPAEQPLPPVAITIRDGIITI